MIAGVHHVTAKQLHAMTVNLLLCVQDSAAGATQCCTLSSLPNATIQTSMFLLLVFVLSHGHVMELSTHMHVCVFASPSMQAHFPLPDDVPDTYPCLPVALMPVVHARAVSCGSLLIAGHRKHWGTN